MGRIVEFENPITIDESVKRIKNALNLKHVQLGLSRKDPKRLVKKVALCAGSGSGVFANIDEDEDIDLYITGELSHHEMLAYVGNGSHIMVCGHCNTERGFLGEMAIQLTKSFPDSVHISEMDVSPFDTV